jgi:hypothetical protein
MSIIRRLFGLSPGSLDDPVLGSLKYADKLWSGTTRWPHSPQPVSLTVHRDDAGPQDKDRALYQAVTRNYPGLQSAIHEALFHLWQGAQAELGASAPHFATAVDLGSQLQVQGIGLHADGHAEFIFGFAGEGEPDGAFIVSVRDHTVVPLEYVA